MEPIWQLQWIEQDRGTTGDDKREILVSISADGRIAKWVIRKGLDCHGKEKIPLINRYQVISLLLQPELKIPKPCIRGEKFWFC